MADPVKGEFARRRTQLMRLMGSDAIAILPAAPVRQRNNDVEYNYRQDSDFYYVTGFSEPEAVAVLIPGDDRPIEERTQALTSWCTGFLYGLGTSGTADPQRLPGELGEIVRDLTEITRAGVDATDGEEANESALAELTEFVRVGVQLVFDELEPLRERHIPPGHVLH